MLNKIMLPADADAQRARLTSAGTALTGHLAETGSAGAGLVVRIRPWSASVRPVGTAQHGRCQRPVRPQAGPGEGP
jgi:hypothetical protein